MSRKKTTEEFIAQAKVSHLRSIAELYYKEGKITKRVYEAILNYPIDEVMKLKRTAALELIKKGE